MDAVRLDPYGTLRAADHKEALAEFIESELERIETGFQERLESQQCIVISGMGVLNLPDFLKLLTTEEFHPLQGYRWLAVQDLRHQCDHIKGSRLSGRDIIHYARQRGYCNG
ncbi:hypothetical protein [Endozoicomonas sp. SCSIO W0465]|uniref:hypothetical protein n=1 Tax=Endozoicomonas sp. SCSIO W0465 TaxID=2918516 RepID=UPI0020764C66|nr:hypothetical protein [Endozoicomonas sp. SCSIO W0465]USE36915.1 hypothetical protein MJO57_01340 [Endozoicomonas sp. SCSIO W0465]